MGTFHHGKGDLHGITVVVDTTGAQIAIGRCDTVTPEGVILLDADVHDADESDVTKEAWVKKAAMMGHWPRHPRIVVPTDQVASITKLGDV